MMTQKKSQQTIIVGDVHGCLDELTALITKVNYLPGRDSLYFLGDIINRGPKSKDCFMKVQELKGISILGNHEWHLLDRFYHNKKSDRLEQLKQEFGKDFNDFIDTISRWPVFIETKDFILVHGGLIPGKPPCESDSKILTSIRTWDGKGIDLSNPDNPPWFELYTDHKLAVFGHWAALEGICRDNVIGLDTGCVYGKKLSALILPERKIVSVPAARIYYPVK